MNDCSSTEEGAKKGSRREGKGEGEGEEASRKRRERERRRKRKEKALEGWPVMLLACEPGPWRMIPIVLSMNIRVEREMFYL